MLLTVIHSEIITVPPPTSDRMVSIAMRLSSRTSGDNPEPAHAGVMLTTTDRKDSYIPPCSTLAGLRIRSTKVVSDHSVQPRSRVKGRVGQRSVHSLSHQWVTDCLKIIQYESSERMPRRASRSFLERWREMREVVRPSPDRTMRSLCHSRGGRHRSGGVNGSHDTTIR